MIFRPKQKKVRYTIVSRDQRTANHFRHAWLAACSQKYLATPEQLNRRPHFVLHYFFKLIMRKNSTNRILVFGVAEALLICFLRPNVVVITGLGRLLGKKSKWRKVYFLILRLFYKNRTIVVLNTEDTRIFRAIGFSQTIKLSGEGFEPKLPYFAHADHLDCESCLPLRIIYVGRLLVSKGVQQILDDFVVWSKTYPGKLELMLIGDTDFNNNDSIDKYYFSSDFLCANPNIKLVGYTKDISHYINKHTIYLSLSDREGMPFSVLEMLDAGIPCILSSVPGHNDLRDIENILFLRGGRRLSDLQIDELQNLSRSRPAQIDRYRSCAVEKEILAYMKRGLI